MVDDLTVCISSYDPKRKELLNKAIRSIKNQTLKPKEVIIVDNNKELNNRYLVNKLNNNSSINFKYFKFTKKGGAFGVRNFFVKKISTQYVAFLDDDDFWDKNYLLEFSKLNNYKKYDLILTNTNFIQSGKKNVIFHIDEKDFTIEKIGLYNPGIRSSATIVKTKSFLKIKGYDLKLYYGSADKDFLVNFIKAKMKIKINKKVLVSYLLHPQSHSRNNVLMLKSIIKYYNKHRCNISNLYKLRYLKRMFILYFLNLTSY